MPEDDPPRKPTARERRDARLAGALRANLKRRKAAARAAERPTPAAPKPGPSKPDA